LTLTQLRNGFLSKDASIAAGVLLALIIWSLNRLVDGVTGTAAIEYSQSVSTDKTVADGSRQMFELAIANLSRDTAVQNLTVTVAAPNNNPEFVEGTARCIFPAPQWVDDSQCDGHNTGVVFQAPWVLPGNQVVIRVDYTGTNSDSKPVTRIKADGLQSAKLRMLTPGLETWLIRHQTALLVATLCFATGFYVLTVGAGIAR
jgi:hypothetical protein